MNKLPGITDHMNSRCVGENCGTSTEVFDDWLSTQPVIIRFRTCRESQEASTVGLFVGYVVSRVFGLYPCSEYTDL